MFRVILVQMAAVVLASVIGGMIAGPRGSISSMLGGAVCVLPNLLLALHVKASARRPGFLASFLLGEFFKLTLVVGLLLAVVRGYHDVHMPSLLVGLALATQAVFFLGFWKKI
jgi:ATP synthase protein I